MKKMKSYNLDEKNGTPGPPKRKRKDSDKKKKR